MNRAPTAALTLIAALAAFPAAAADGDGGPNLGEALTGGTFSLDLRYRFETVEQSQLYDEDAFASTLRTALAYRTARWRALELFVEFEDVHQVGFDDDYRDLGPDGGNGVTDRPVVADPELTQVNQASLIWVPTTSLRANLGRQEILVDNHRFVGNVAWRQNHQSFDAARLDVDLGPGTVARYAYLDRVNRIFGDSLPMSSHLAELVHTFASVGTARAYAVLLDYDEPDDASLSRNTYGASLDGSRPVGATSAVSYRLELARQRDAGDNPDRVDADYLRLDLGLDVDRFGLAVGCEVLGGAPGDGSFQTPLATLHAFNGWADVFLVTPANGLEDLFVTLEASLGAWKLTAVWHDFSADSGSAHYGRELDLQAVWTLPWKQAVGLKGAFYDADVWAVDTDKIMLWTQWGF